MIKSFFLNHGKSSENPKKKNASAVTCISYPGQQKIQHEYLSGVHVIVNTRLK